LVAGAGSFSASTLIPESGGVEFVPESVAVPVSPAGLLAPESGVEASELALAELVSAELAVSVFRVDKSEAPESLLAAVEGAESAESLVLESTVSESEESEDLVSAESEEEPSELSDDLESEESEDLESEELASEESEDLASAESEEEEASELSDDLESDDLESEELASELSAVLSDALTEAGSAADARVGAAMTMTTSTSPHRAAARTAILRALASGRAHSVVPMPVTSRHTSSKRGTVSPTVLQFQPRGVSR
jgi:hypothetical protein